LSARRIQSFLDKLIAGLGRSGAAKDQTAMQGLPLTMSAFGGKADSAP